MESFDRRRIWNGRLYNADEMGNVKPLVSEDSDDEKNTVLGHLNILLKYFQKMLIIPDQPDTQNIYINKVQNLLFDLMEKEMLEYMTPRKGFSRAKISNGHQLSVSQVYNFLQLSDEFRQELQLEESPLKTKLRMTHKELWCQKASDEELMVDFLKGMDFSGCEPRGDLNVSAIHQGHGKWKVELKSIAQLKPRLGRDALNFSVVTKVLPGENSRFETRVFEDSCCQIFDLNEDDEECPQHTFYLEGVQADRDFLQIVVYDHSATGVCKIFRAISLMPLEKEFEGHVPMFSCPSPTKSDAVWSALCSRARIKEVGKVGRFVRSVKNYAFERRIPFVKLPDSCI